MMIRTIVKPVGYQIERLHSNTGLEQYTINARLEKRDYEIAGKSTSVYLFCWQDVAEESVRQAMVRNFAVAHGMNWAESVEKLSRILSAVPCNQVEITEIEVSE